MIKELLSLYTQHSNVRSTVIKLSSDQATSCHGAVYHIKSDFNDSILS